MTDRRKLSPRATRVIDSGANATVSTEVLNGGPLIDVSVSSVKEIQRGRKIGLIFKFTRFENRNGNFRHTRSVNFPRN